MVCGMIRIVGLVPTRVGMILNIDMMIINDLSCPHTRGDDPGDIA